MKPTRRKHSLPCPQESLDRCTALMLGCAAGRAFPRVLELALLLPLYPLTGPVMAGMMAGYVDVPVTCLTAMLQDKDKQTRAMLHRL